MTKKREKLYLIDGSSYIFRAFFAIRSLSNSKGLPTNALYGFTRMLLKFVNEEKPDKLAVVFDTKEPTFRDEMYEDYKANRKEPPEDLVPQFEYFEPIVDALNIKQIAMPGYEADDVIGTVAKRAEEDGLDVIVITSDKDFMQLVDDHITLFDTMKERWVSFPEVKKKFGVKPEQVTDVMGLIGDSSDNIPGVRGIGPKGAEKLINQYGNLENLISNIDKLSNLKVKNALKDGVKDAELSKALATIKLDVPLEFKWDEFNVSEPDTEKMKELFSELEFFKLLRELLPNEDVEEEKEQDFSVISNNEELEALSKKLEDAKSFSIYFLGDSGRQAFPYIGLAVSWAGGHAAYIPVAHETLEDVPNISVDLVHSFLGKFSDKSKYIFDAKDALRRFWGAEIGFGNIVDVRLMSYVLNSSYPSDVVTLGQQILGIHISSENPKSKTQNPKKKSREHLSVNEAKNQSTQLADITLQLAERFIGDLSENEKLNKLYYELEMPLMTVLLDMEKKGIKVDSEKLNRLSKEYDKKITDLEKKIYENAGETFSINSPKQLAHILFEKLELPVIKKTKTGYSTDAGVLTQLAEEYELPQLVLEYRSLAKLKSTYIDVLPTLADDQGRVHTTFNQAVTATGRLSSSDPNLQNIPARTEEGLRIREAFIADKGFKLMSADYSQIELRILAHIAEEPALLEAFEKGVDIHSMTASKIFGVDVDKVDKKMRGEAKTVNFGVLYGQGAFGLSKQLDIEIGEADSYIKNYYENYPKVKELKEKILKDAEKNGYVETIFGRRRYVPDINSTNKSVKAFAERTAFNAVFQGTSADIIKMAMLDIDKIIEKDFKDVSMLLQVHDELVFEVPESKTDPVSKIVCEKMCGVIKLKVPLDIDIGIGNNWAECK